MELLAPWWGELGECFLLNFIRFMPTFVYSRKRFEKLIEGEGMRIERPVSKTITQLQSPFDFLPPILDLEWLRVPVFAIPYSFLFSFIPTPGGK